jgi:dinuclear metal center YbgI/SA1388 family protein
MNVQDITSFLETLAPSVLQEDYDNAGLIIGSPSMECTGILVSLDATPEVIREAISKKCNLVVAHHPIVFRGLKKINGKNYVEEAVMAAIKNDIAVYAIHTNLDNIIHGVNGKIADLLGLVNRRVLAPGSGRLKKLAVYVPVAHRDTLMDALFAAGAGHIGRYSECSFSVEGTGTFLAGEGTDPFVGEKGKRHTESENRLEVIFPSWLQGRVMAAMQSSHPYEEIAYEVYSLDNQYNEIGSGLIGDLPVPVSETEMLQNLSQVFRVPVIRHTVLKNKQVSRVALCGGAGSFLTRTAIAAGADMFITADVKYHEFFDAEGRLVLADIGHFESEQFTTDLLIDQLSRNFPNFAVLKTGVHTNPVMYFKG